MVYNNADQLVKWPGMHGDSTHDGYVYDGAGNLTQVKDATGLSTVSSYTYTPSGLMNVATYHDKSGVERTLTNTWDADSNRVRLSDGTTQWTYTYDPTAGIPAVLVEDDGGGHPFYYFREPGGALIARVQMGVYGASGRYYLFDGLGSTRMLVCNAQGTTDSYAYDAYGNAITHNVPPGWSSLTTDNPYQYVGQLGYYTHYMAPDFGLLQLGVRFYDPEVGRFTQRDWVRDEASMYAYCRGRVTTSVDPEGQWPWTQFLCTVGCKASYDLAKAACAIYTPSKASCIAIAMATYTACVAGCTKLTCTPTWTLVSASNWWKNSDGNQCQTLTYKSSDGRGAICVQCWREDPYANTWTRVYWGCTTF